ncbi:MBL fold metallo-hydrolase [Gryllotalpicola koreensis]|uniref:MBL fold metallo-hydrolase n=1 Tax=Gryllotalpicola koreensis TaxID=993086 RepID=A0ABP7ZYF2_9MICO
MRATSPAQYAAFELGAVPPVEQLRDGVWSIPNPMPGQSNGLTSTLCYLIEGGDGALHLIDPGLGHDAGYDAVADGIARTGHAVSELASIVVTHLHTDHLGLAARLRAESGASLVLHRREQWAIDHADELGTPLDAQLLDEWGVPAERRAELLAVPSTAGHPVAPIRADVLVDGGGELPIAGRRLRVVDTPGHTPGSMSLVDDESELVFTGDALLPTIHPGIGLGGTVSNPVGDYLRSLRTLEEHDDYEACPGHEFRFTEVASRCRTTGEHQLRRSREVAAAVVDSPEATVWQLASRLHWTAGFAQLRDFYLRSALAQTQMHLDFVRSPAAAEFLTPASAAPVDA